MRIREPVKRKLVPALSEEHLATLWAKWRAGERLADIAKAMKRERMNLFRCLKEHGGISPRVRRIRDSALTLEEREEISRGLCSNESLRSIARRLGRQASTISREVALNEGRDGYRAIHADDAAKRRSRRPQFCKLALSARLRRVVTDKLQHDWSPTQISGWLRTQHPLDDAMNISHESIYRTLYLQARGVLKKELQTHLRTRRVIRQARTSTRKRPDISTIPDAVSIRDRPAEIEDRAVPGHWEGDLVVGAGFTYMATLVERKSRYTMLVKLPCKETDVVVAAIQKHITKLPVELRRSLTWDRGMEMAAHKDFTIATDVAVFFCDPASPWQKGTNENTNGLLRQYFPKTASLAPVTQAEMNRVARLLNGRPRKTLGFQTPAESLSLVLR